MKPKLSWTVLVLGLVLVSAPLAAQRRGDCPGVTAEGWRASMVPEGEPGEPMIVSGRVLDADGEPVAGVYIYAYQTDDEGHYSRGGTAEVTARLCTKVRTNEGGEYRLETIRPGSYPNSGVAAHIHFELWREGEPRQRQDLQFADDDRIPDRRKHELTRTSTVRPVERDAEGVLWVERDFLLR